MSDKREGFPLNSGIDKLKKLISDSSTDTDMLKDFAESSESEEAAFNVMRIDGKKLPEESKSKLILFGKMRMAYLKSKFNKSGGGRDMAGKMEYDTIKSEIDDLEDD